MTTRSGLFRRLGVLALGSLLIACAGERPPTGQADLGVTPGHDWGGGFQVDTDHAAGEGGVADGLAVHEGGGCPQVTAGTYTGTLAGSYTGTISFKVAAGAGGLTVESGAVVVTKSGGGATTFPFVLPGLTCGALHSALGRPPGSTGGTDLRGTLDGTFTAPGTFKGAWNLPGDATGTFKAKL